MIFFLDVVMLLWTSATPYRDGDFEAGIVIHELTHGLSTRLTGGPANSACLRGGESGGMGEGWGGGFYLPSSFAILMKYRLPGYHHPKHQELFRLCDGCLGCEQGEWYQELRLLSCQYHNFSFLCACPSLAFVL